MGIRKHFEEMKGEKEVTKLSDFSVDVKESKKKKFDFDLEKELDESDWREIKNYLKTEVEGYVDGRAILNTAANLKSLFPDHFEAMGIFSSRKDFIKSLSKIKSEGRITPDIMASCKILFPDDYQKFDYGKNMSEWALEWLEELDSFLRRGISGMYEFSENFLSFILLFPEKGNEIRFEDKDIKELKRIYLRSKKIASVEVSSHIASTAKLINPDEFDTFGITKDDFNKMVEKLRDSKAKVTNWKWSAFFSLAMNLRIISADEIRVSDKGIEFVDDEIDWKQEKKSRPVRKQF